MERNSPFFRLKPQLCLARRQQKKQDSKEAVCFSFTQTQLRAPFLSPVTAARSLPPSSPFISSSSQGNESDYTKRPNASTWAQLWKRTVSCVFEVSWWEAVWVCAAQGPVTSRKCPQWGVVTSLTRWGHFSHHFTYSHVKTTVGPGGRQRRVCQI